MTKSAATGVDARSGQKRVKTGCRTCRIRKVKCDEAKPSCRRCTDTGRKCDGYPRKPDSPPVALLVIRHDVPCSHWNPDSRNAFQYFFEVSAPTLMNFGSQYFWNQLVLQVSHQEDSIKHLVVAASILDRQEQACGQRSESNPGFFHHYGKALQSLSNARNLDTGVTLIACLLFVICDEFRHKRFSALQHVFAGRNILADYCKQRSRSQYNTTVEELGRIFGRLELHTGELDHEILPGQAWCPFASRRNAFVPQPTRPRLDFGEQHPSVFQGHQSMTMAGLCLQSMAPSCMAPQPNMKPPNSRFHVVPHVTVQLNLWLSSFDPLCSKVDANDMTPERRNEIHFLRIYHKCLNVMSQCAPFDNETLYDQYVSQFEQIITKSGFLLSFNDTDIEVVAEKLLCPLFFTALHFRDVSVRRKALRFLLRCGWDGISLAAIAEQVIAIEEQGHADAVVAADIPESNRIRVAEVNFSKREGQDDSQPGTICTLLYSINPYRDPSSIRAHKFRWDAVRDLTDQDLAGRLLQRMLLFEFLERDT